ncbi:MAG: hydantoinase B/oxoprolinase family protein, partial [Planctomycetota bacterium]
LIEANVRVPRLVIGDCHAIAGAFRVGGQRLAEFLSDYGAEHFQRLCDEILTRSAAAMAEAIAAIPDGRYEGVAVADGVQEPTRVQLAVTVAGDRLTVDFTGSSPQQENAGVNCVLNVTFAHTVHPLKSALLPDLPNNEGLFRPITVTAPEGSIFNCRFPAPVKARTKTSYHIHQALYEALVGVLPHQVQAGSGSLWALRIWGRDEEGDPVAVHVLPYGGKGALFDRDGLPTIAFPSNGTITPAEIIENHVNVLVARRALRADSGGPGEYRGGLGQEIAVRALGERPVRVGVRPDKIRFPAPGVSGGRHGAPGEVLMDGKPAGQGPFPLSPGSELVLRLPGGGGFGDPLLRDRARIALDVAEGFVTVDAAGRDYPGWSLADKP